MSLTEKRLDPNSTILSSQAKLPNYDLIDLVVPHRDSGIQTGNKLRD